MAASTIISIVEAGALHRGGSIGEDSGNYISAKIAIHLFNHVAMGFHPQSVTQPYDGLALLVTAEMDVSLAITLMPFQNSPKVLQIFFFDFVQRQFYLDGLSEVLLGFEKSKNPMSYYLCTFFFLLENAYNQEELVHLK
jgi:hypothetical protein